MRTLFLPTIALVCAVTCGCARDTDRARESARIFLSALNQNDIPAMQAVATTAARPNLAMLFKESHAEKGGFSLGDAVVTGDGLARVPGTFSGENKRTGSAGTPMSVLLRREEKEWRVYALKIDATPESSLTMDFEHPEQVVGEAFALMGRELGKGMEQAGRALGEALGGFAKGLSEGLSKSAASPPPADPR